MSEIEHFEKVSRVLKVDESLGLVFGFAAVSTEGGEPYFDKQGDHITEQALLEASVDFALSSRVSGDMHERPDGEVVFLYPLTAEVAKALDIQTPRTGLLVAVRPSPEVFEKFKKGEYTGFSIGGTRVEEEVVE